VQIDELDLAWEDDIERGRHRRARAGGGGGGRSSRKRKKKGRGKTFLALFFSLVVLGGVGLGFYYGADRVRDLLTTPDYSSAGEGEVTIEITSGQTARDIGQTLAKNDVVKSAKAFVNAAEANPRSKEIQPGFYKLKAKMRADLALDMLLDRANRVVNQVTIPEGLITLEVYAKLSQATNIPVDQFKEAAKDPVKLGIPDWWFTRLDKKKASGGLEGFLFPATYEIPPNPTAESVLKAMVKKFLDVTSGIKFAETVQAERNISPYEALIAASIAEAEAQTAADMGKVARVVYNRAYTGKFPCNCLQLDSAVNYWFKISGAGARDPDEFKQSEIHNLKNPYNTHDVAGLPIGPLGNPGEKALQAAMRPPTGTWVYFVTVDKAGTTMFSSSWSEFQGHVRIACRNKILTGASCP
jgi:UPF0755 protein